MQTKSYMLSTKYTISVKKAPPNSNSKPLLLHCSYQSPSQSVLSSMSMSSKGIVLVTGRVLALVKHLGPFFGGAVHIIDLTLLAAASSASVRREQVVMVYSPHLKFPTKCAKCAWRVSNCASH
eukprot:6483874-Amphidinium_carterae.1